MSTSHADEGTTAPQHDRSQDEQERLDRQMEELLQELRVAMPGVQVLFGFLLAVPFQQGFRQVTEFQEYTYFGTLLAAATATALLIAPSAYHRVTFKTAEKPNIIKLGTAQMLLGLVALALAMNGAVLLVTDVLFEAPTVVVTVAALTTLYFTLWFFLGLARRASK